MQVDLVFRDLQPIDLDELHWSGGPAHLNALTIAMEDSWVGAVEILVGVVNGFRVIAHGGVDYRKHADAGEIWMLAVHEAWQGLGIGARLIAELEARVRRAGLQRVSLNVETDNSRAKALYASLGYRRIGHGVDPWPLDDGSVYEAQIDVMSRDLGASA